MNIIRSRHKQKGLSTPGWIAVVAIFGYLLITFFRIFPMYYDNFKVKSVLEGIQQDQAVDAKSKRAIMDSMNKRLAVQGVRGITRDNVKITRKDGKTTVVVTYEIKADYIANLFIGARFVESVVIDR
ncbi:MAG: DUF4845 domain-containing protein [Pseudomonadota bacterium]